MIILPEDTELVLGIGKYEQKKGLLNIIIRYETLFTALQYMAFAIKGSAFMGVGRNMAYIVCRHAMVPGFRRLGQ